MASAVSKDQFRRKVYLLGKLQSIASWRGQIVDDVISTVLIEGLRRHERITLEQVRKRAHEAFNRELQFALTNAKLTSSEPPSSPLFVALHSLYYDGSVKREETDTALAEIDAALTKLFAMAEVKEALKSASILIAQRSLVFRHSGVSVRAVPDLLAFYKDRPPIVVDWKVHTFGIQEAWLQLGVYALALTRCSPHKDFPAGLTEIPATAIELLEVQLLTGSCRKSRLEPEDLEKVESYMAESISEIDAAVGGRKYPELKPDDFDVAYYPNTCKTCAFQEVCWRENELH